MKLVDFPFACKSLTNSEYEAQAMTGNGSFLNCNLHEKLVRTLWVNLFSAGFSHLEPLCATAVNSDYRRAPGRGSRKEVDKQEF